MIAESTSTKPAERIALLLAIAIGAGVVAIVAGFVVHFPEHWKAPTARSRSPPWPC